mmetsp:Transcript_9208/g.17282  ORF Transcript_9208/g.17282 Transcript_9208/m.17282 type:complete len:179 (-) Transcript_9208:397-933(-)
MDGLCITLIIIFLGLNIATWIITRNEISSSKKKQQELLKEISHLRKEAEKHNTPDSYFLCAKQQRLAHKKEKELQMLENNHSPQVTNSITLFCKIFKTLLFAFFLLTMMRTPIARIPTDISFPLGRFLEVNSKGRLTAENVSLLPFLFLIDRGTTFFAKALFPVRVETISEDSKAKSL